MSDAGKVLSMTAGFQFITGGRLMSQVAVYVQPEKDSATEACCHLEIGLCLFLCLFTIF